MQYIDLQFPASALVESQGKVYARDDRMNSLAGQWVDRSLGPIDPTEETTEPADWVYRIYLSESAAADTAPDGDGLEVEDINGLSSTILSFLQRWQEHVPMKHHTGLFRDTMGLVKDCTGAMLNHTHHEVWDKVRKGLRGE